MWEIVIQMKGDEPKNTEDVEAIEENLMNILDEAGFDYADLSAK